MFAAIGTILATVAGILGGMGGALSLTPQGYATAVNATQPSLAAATMATNIFSIFAAGFVNAAGTFVTAAGTIVSSIAIILESL